jgi:hypothetical protein
MKTHITSVLSPIGFILLFSLNLCFAGQLQLNTPNRQSPFRTAELTGRIEDSRLVECSGMDTSLITNNLIWAINDSGDGPFIYALGYDGRKLGRLQVVGAQNRDWEGLDTFIWQNRPMILIADFGDNKEKHTSHTLYIVEEPQDNDQVFADDLSVEIAWQIIFSYPDGEHDAEGVAVDGQNSKVLVLTKRDDPPLLFALPLIPQEAHVVARRLTAIAQIPPPSAEDMQQKYGKYRSQPTALDISLDGNQAVVLTYKHAYLFTRQNNVSWQKAFSGQPFTIPLPLPEDQVDLRQREAICFTHDGKSLLVTSEGKSAGIYILKSP